MSAGASFKTKAHPNFSTLNTLYTPVKITNPYGREFTWNTNANLNEVLSVLSNPVINDVDTDNIQLLDFTTKFQQVKMQNGVLSLINTPINGTITSNKITWASSANTGYKEGVSLPVSVGDYVEMTFRHLSPTALSSGAILVGASRDDGSMLAFNFNPNNKQVVVFYLTTTVIKVINLDVQGKTSNFYAFSNTVDSSINIALRLVGTGAVEFYINGVLFYKFSNLDAIFTGFHFLVDDKYTQYVSLENPMKMLEYNPHSSKPINIAMIGDSITDKVPARGSFEYGQLMQYIAHGVNGLGEITRTNYGIAGSNTYDWANGATGVPSISTYNFSSFDYVTIMLGTNELTRMSSIHYDAYASSLKTIGDKIVADGSIPIFGLFPINLNTDAGIDNEYGNEWYARSGELISILKKVCTENGWKLAEPRNYFGANWNYLGDNLHPRDLGMALIAKSFIVAMAQLAKPKFIDFNLLNNPYFIGCKLSNQAAVTIPNGELTKYPFNYVNFNYGNLHNTDKVKIKQNGIYQIYAKITFSTNVTGLRFISIYKNGFRTEDFATQAVSDAGKPTSVSLSSILECVEGDILEVYLLQTSGGNLDTMADGTYKSIFTVYKM